MDEAKIDNMTFKELYGMCDFLFAQIFEGNSIQKTLTKIVIRKIYEVQKWWLLAPETSKPQKECLSFTKML